MTRYGTYTTIHAHDYPALVAQQERELPLRSALGAGMCQMCGASPCRCAELGDTYSEAEWAQLETKGRV